MNDPHEPLSDEVIEELLAPLRAAKLTDEIRSANRAAVHLALARHYRPVWWRRSVAVPVPLAIAASLALMVMAAASLWPARSGPATDSSPRQLRQTSIVETNAGNPGWSVTRSYILSIESLARMQYSFRPEVKEDRNDT